MQTENALVNTLRANNFFFSVLLRKKAEAELLLSCKVLLRSLDSISSLFARKGHRRFGLSLFAQEEHEIGQRVLFVEAGPLRTKTILRASSTASHPYLARWIHAVTNAASLPQIHSPIPLARI
ncbi:hypothetical protein SAMN05443245_6738 [Paraburkholderia fungorum]|uniref:Uncharacterized protein n=1 Tax=Paraburkholderia fungorum TaxID=134537 RepID=A0A1H1JL65_9BURK|nr:hypothetical protein [Paraburkholderia fungorum]SDR50724.1 hypothetical protein SAMN05443245_6738 [Paraburkholderia fungorum]